jgi:hypothetical protein
MSLTPYFALRARVHGKRKKPSYAPGPYHVAGNGPRIRSIKNAGGRTIAHVLFSERRAGECQATAKLLAAAPELLFELRSFVRECGCGGKGKCERCFAAQAAITKAEGI